VNLYVHDNTVRQSSGIAAGLNLYLESDQSYYTSGNNHWEGNAYYLDDLDAARFMWSAGPVGADGWRSYGHDKPSGDFKQIA
jgi:hypothetical protein